jgi:excisionase family DNA binding protein
MPVHVDPQSQVESEPANERWRVESDSDFEPLLDVVEAAKLLRIHPKTLRMKARSGIIPGIRFGRLWRFRASALNRWLKKIES